MTKTSTLTVSPLNRISCDFSHLKSKKKTKNRPADFVRWSIKLLLLTLFRSLREPVGFNTSSRQLDRVQSIVDSALLIQRLLRTEEDTTRTNKLQRCQRQDDLAQTACQLRRWSLGRSCLLFNR